MWFWWGGYKIRHAIISDDLNSIEKLQSKNWPYFIKCLLEVSDGDISSLNLINLSQNRIDTNELKIINDTIENLEICKSYYSDIHAKCWLCFSRLSTECTSQSYPKNARQHKIEFISKYWFKKWTKSKRNFTDIWYFF